ncbi:hypothetical protein SAMN06265348_109299 [Pedobacter westerhofensis]|uniref:Uncharacterized protein n=1 Tax=Pedobacter westerhofensis TaxID=425512 RepID=A0A521EY96_9SPHI|nr:hypothetical protein SAMN06265348_109299 [Pedobacter westerhofensis]
MLISDNNSYYNDASPMLPDKEIAVLFNYLKCG